MMAFIPCPTDCPGRRIGDDDGPRPAADCPVNAARDRWGWPCRPSMAEFLDTLPDDGGRCENNLATLAQ